MILDLKKLGIEGTYTLDTMKQIPDSAFPVLNGSSQLIYEGGNERAHLFLGDILTHGAYGDIRSASRVKNGKSETVLVKSPRLPEMNLKMEAIVQTISRGCLEKQNISWAIPEIYDIYQYKGKMSFSMEKIKGQYLHEWFLKTKEPDLDFYKTMIQLCIILSILHNCLELDHRDLKSDNLFIRNESCSLQFKHELNTYIVACPFQVALLDFGFACVGDHLGLGTEVLPVLDPCPKEGRDLFHFLISVLSIETIRKRLSTKTLDQIDLWLGNKYASLAKRFANTTETWVHLVTSKTEFRSQTSSPYRVLQDIVTKNPELFFLSP
jgi:serine/threonine protein kinase